MSIVRPEHSLSTIPYHQPAATHTASAESRHPPTPTPIVTMYATRPCIQPPAPTPKRNEKKRSSLQPSCMHANPTRPTCDHKSRTSSNRSGDNEIHPTRLPTYLAIDPLVHPPDSQTNLISPSVIRQKPTIDKTDVAVRVPSRPGSQVQDCPGHLVFDSHPLRRNKSPRHHAARVLPRFGDGGCHVGGEP